MVQSLASGGSPSRPRLLQDSIARDGGLPQRHAAVVARHESGGQKLEAVCREVVLAASR